LTEGEERSPELPYYPPPPARPATLALDLPLVKELPSIKYVYFLTARMFFEAYVIQSYVCSKTASTDYLKHYLRRKHVTNSRYAV